MVKLFLNFTGATILETVSQMTELSGPKSDRIVQAEKVTELEKQFGLELTKILFIK